MFEYNNIELCKLISAGASYCCILTLSKQHVLPLFSIITSVGIQVFIHNFIKQFSSMKLKKKRIYEIHSYFYAHDSFVMSDMLNIIHL